MEPIYEGKAKRLFTTDNPDELLMEFKDDATAFNGEKHAQFANKGQMNHEISKHLYKLLEQKGVPTHHVRDVDEIRVIVKRVEIVPIEMVIRNVVAGSLSKRTGLDEGHVLERPIVETYYKDDDLGDPIITTEHIDLLKLCTPTELAEMERLSLQVNDVLLEVFASAGIRLIDFKLEFGRNGDQILLADEISPDTCRLWDAETNEKLDKDRFRRDLGGVMEAYANVLERIRHAVSI